MLYKLLFFLALVSASGVGAEPIDQFAQGLKNVGQEALNEKLFDEIKKIFLDDVEQLNKVKELVAQGADISAKTPSARQEEFTLYAGYTPLHMAAFTSKLDIVKYLVEQGVPLEAKDDLGKTPFLVTNSCEILKYLKDKGANVNAQDNHGNTALVRILKYLRYNITLIKCLVEECKTDIDFANHNGSTPLHYAVDNGSPDAVDYLVKKGAEINVQNKRGETPLDIARWNEKYYTNKKNVEAAKKSAAIKELLIAKGGKSGNDL